jgi:hypothetical protein
MRQLVWLDLCSGLGGASQPALDRGWKVIRVDIDPRFKPDIVADVRALPLRPFHVDVLWASPPCQEFSKHGIPCFFPNQPEPDLSIAIGVKAEIERLIPRFWCVENVWPSRKWLSRIFGPVSNRPSGHALWSNLGFLLPNIPPHKGKISGDKRWGPMGHGRKGGTDNHKRQAAVTAIIPYEIGEAICRAVEARGE